MPSVPSQAGPRRGYSSRVSEMMTRSEGGGWTAALPTQVTTLSPSQRFDRLVRAESAAWLLLVLVAVVLRVYDLGARVMSHDESIHSFYGYELLRRGAYTHDPTYHGPLLYHLNALVFFFLGASDATARLSTALAGTALVAVLWLFRPWLGRAGAFGAATAVALSPSLLFYSRQVWMDMHVALFTMIWIYG